MPGNGAGKRKASAGPERGRFQREAESSPEREAPRTTSSRVRLPVKRVLAARAASIPPPLTTPTESEAGRTYFASNSEPNTSLSSTDESSTSEDDDEEGSLDFDVGTPRTRRNSNWTLLDGPRTASPEPQLVEPKDPAAGDSMLLPPPLPHQAPVDSRRNNSAGRGAQVLVERSSKKQSSSSRLFPDPPATLQHYLLRSPSPGPSSSAKRRASPAGFSHTHVASGSHAQHAYTASPRAFNTPVHGGGRRFRLDILCEVVVLTCAMALASFRISSLPISDIIPPAAPLIIITILMPFITLFRRSAPSTHLMVPFTDERGYRDRNAADDGFASGVGLPVLLAAGVVWDARVALQNSEYIQLPDITMLTDLWTAANPTLPKPVGDAPAKILLDSRIALLCLTTLNVYVLILHLLLSRTVLRVNWLPLSNTKRFFGALLLSSTLSALGGTVTALFAHFGHASPYVSPLELTISSFIYQMSLYMVSRFARRGFTLGELAMTTATGVSLGLEFWRVTRARWLYSRLFLLPATFRCPTPLVLYQAVLIPGAFLIGFLLSPLLVLSRHIASKPSYRLRWPAEKDRNRKLLAAASLLGVCAISVLLHGGWVAWQLQGGLLTSWSWAARFVLLGADGVDGMHGEFSGWTRWRRLALALYWLSALFFAVGGWQRRLTKTRRLRIAQANSAPGTGLVGEKDMTTVCNGVRDERRQYHHQHISLDLRRKFFHAMVVIVFVPGIAFDPAFTSLAFSLAFCLFTFAEFARYFALYPIGAPIHVFFHEFVDSKDGGPVILSHFYLLTGCAGGLWLEGKGIKRFAGVVSLGIGDALASLVGRRIGGARWPGTNKTIGGTIAFTLSTFVFSLLLAVLGLSEPFPKWRYLLATVLTGLLEATSTQNDNLTLPIFFWAVQALLEI